MWAAILIPLEALLLAVPRTAALHPICATAVGCQSPRSGTRTTLEDARPFLGEWLTSAEGPSGSYSLAIGIRTDGEHVVATVSSDLLGDGRIDEVRNTEKGIVLRYTGALWGYVAPIVLTLAREGDQLRVDVSIMNGMFTSASVARKQPYTRRF